MAKKKVTHQDKPPQTQEQTHQTTAMDQASEKIESLKSLNAMLLKETVERRQQVDSLLHSKGSLESELTRSETQKEVLQTELTRLSDRTVEMELERNLAFMFVAVQVKQQTEVIEKERDGFVREKAEIENRLGNLEREMRNAVIEKSEIEKVKSEKESEIGLLEEKLNKLIVEIDIEREVSNRVCCERDAFRTELDGQIEEANGLRLNLIDAEKREREIQDEFQKLSTEYSDMREGEEKRERMIESMMRDKDAIERSLEEMNWVIEDLKREMEGVMREKQGVEEERNEESKKRIELENSVKALNDTVLSLREEEERLRVNVADLEKMCFEGVEKQKQMVMQIDALMEENKETRYGFAQSVEGNGLLIRELDELSSQLDEYKKRLEKMVREKAEIQEIKLRLENENFQVKKEVTRLGDADHAALKLEQTNRDQMEKIKQLLSEITQNKDELALVITERDDALNGLGEEKRNGFNLRANLMKMEKNIKEIQGEVGKIKTENCNLLEEKKELESHFSMMKVKIASLEKSLVEARKELDDKEAKVGIADAKLELALKMLRNAVDELVSMSKEERSGTKEESILVDEQKFGKEIKRYVADLEAIKTAFKNRESKVDDMNRQVEYLQNSIAEVHKKKSFWTMVSSATTIFAAASVAYVAHGR